MQPILINKHMKWHLQRGDTRNKKIGRVHTRLRIDRPHNIHSWSRCIGSQYAAVGGSILVRGLAWVDAVLPADARSGSGVIRLSFPLVAIAGSPGINHPTSCLRLACYLVHGKLWSEIFLTILWSALTDLYFYTLLGVYECWYFSRVACSDGFESKYGLLLIPPFLLCPISCRTCIVPSRLWLTAHIDHVAMYGHDISSPWGPFINYVTQITLIGPP